MTNVRIRIFTEDLFKFCFRRRGIEWQPPPRDAQAANAVPLFQDGIGITVLNTCIEFQQNVHQHSTDICNTIVNFPLRLQYAILIHMVPAALDEIIDNENYNGQVQCTYVFLAVMIEAAAQSARTGNRHLIHSCVSITADILDNFMPYDFIQNFYRLLLYPFNHGQPPAN